MTLAAASSIVNPSPSKSNPFARPKPTSSSSFTRTSILPTLPSPRKSGVHDVQHTPGDKLNNGTNTSGSATRGGKAAWRLLWRGGLEIGYDGWRLDGITFFALLNLVPPTPSQQTPNPFDVPSVNPTSPFAMPGSDTDLCLSLESMRGRKYLQVRGLLELGEDEVLEGDGAEDNGSSGVQMSIAPTAPLLISYFTSLLCRHPTLSPSGRTLSAIVIGLGDESVDSPGSSVLIYGQRSVSQDAQVTLKLCVGRKRVIPIPASEKKVRPGEPLPRPPLFFPAKAPRKPPPPFPRRSRSGSRSFSWVPSVASIYHPPAVQTQHQQLPPAPLSGRTPGRRGEKRARMIGEEDIRRRKAGKIIIDRARPDQESGEFGESGNDASGSTHFHVEQQEDDDIFGNRVSSIVPQTTRENENPADTTASGQKKRRVPQQILDNKATIRKQTMVTLEERGCARHHTLFKEVFGMTTKGAYFAFRDVLETGPLGKVDIQRIIKGHLNMYLPAGHEEVKEEEEELFGELWGEREESKDSADDHGLSSEPGLAGPSDGVDSEGMMMSESDFTIKGEEASIV